MDWTRILQKTLNTPYNGPQVISTAGFSGKHWPPLGIRQAKSLALAPVSTAGSPLLFSQSGPFDGQADPSRPVGAWGSVLELL